MVAKAPLLRPCLPALVLVTCADLTRMSLCSLTGSVFFWSVENRFSWRMKTLQRNSWRVASGSPQPPCCPRRCRLTHRGRDSNDELSTDRLPSHHSHLNTTSSSCGNRRLADATAETHPGRRGDGGETHREVPLDHLLHGGSRIHVQGQVGVLLPRHRPSIAPSPRRRISR